mmetsp:Transcript_84997/g.245460  ORF Transcript_84997/g.245460 Transcript_84997/m.245460 type:complete len:307 (+) Transcript_84997:96-1016(+)
MCCPAGASSHRAAAGTAMKTETARAPVGDKPRQVGCKHTPLLDKTKLCKFFQKGRCMRGSACTFAHSTKELQEQPDLYHSQLCYDFMHTGGCRRGAECRFAHGLAELKRLGKAKRRIEGAAAGQSRAEAETPVVRALTEEALYEHQIATMQQHARELQQQLRQIRAEMEETVPGPIHEPQSSRRARRTRGEPEVSPIQATSQKSTHDGGSTRRTTGGSPSVASAGGQVDRFVVPARSLKEPARGAQVCAAEDTPAKLSLQLHSRIGAVSPPTPPPLPPDAPAYILTHPGALTTLSSLPIISAPPGL